MGKYVIKDIKSIIINGKKYPCKPYDLEQTPEEIRGGLGTYKSNIKPIEEADKLNITNKRFDVK